jgi:hypothetical protein
VLACNYFKRLKYGSRNDRDRALLTKPSRKR